MNEVVSVHPVAARLRQHGVEEILILDDAYDIPMVRHVDNVEGFWQALRGDDDARTAFEALSAATEAAEIDDAAIEKLWASRADGTRVSQLGIEHLFGSRLQQLRDLDALYSHLKEIGCEPKKRGARSSEPITARLIFMDYVLDSSAEKRDALSTELARTIYRAAADGRKPFIVLMSDQPEAAREHAAFRENANLIAGLFAFLKKADLGSRDTLLLRLASWGIGNPVFDDLQEFVTAVVDGVKAASESFATRVRALDVHDYSFIQRIALGKEGHPLGDYLMWLFESALGHALRDDARVSVAQAKLDEGRFDRYIPSQRAPSDRVAAFYLAAVTEPAVSSLRPQPQDPAKSAPLLFLGDVFLKDVGSPVKMVATAACDLTFRPMESPGCDLRQPIYLVPGTLVEFGTTSERTSEYCTELVVMDEKKFRIEWDYKHVESVLLGDVRKEMQAAGYDRKWRLRLPYALEIQQAFVHHASRIGLPVAPPFFEEATVQVFAADEKKKAQRVGEPIEGGAALLHGEDETDVILTRECVEGLMQSLATVAEAAERAASGVPEGAYKEARVKAHKDRAQGARNLAAKTDAWLAMLETPFKLPKGENHHVVDAKLLWAYSGQSLEGSPMQPTFFINIASVRSKGGGGVLVAGAEATSKEVPNRAEEAGGRIGGAVVEGPSPEGGGGVQAAGAEIAPKPSVEFEERVSAVVVEKGGEAK